MGQDYRSGVSRWDIKQKRLFATLENEPLLDLFEDMTSDLTIYTSRHNIVWSENEDLLKPYFKNRKSFGHFIGKAFGDKAYTIKQVIDKRITTGKYKQFLKGK